MFEYLPESGEKKKPANKEFERIYLCAVVIFIVALIFQVSLSEKLVYLWYGYNPAIIGTSETQSFRAFRETLATRKLLTHFFVGITFLCFLFSGIAIYLRVYLKLYFTFAVFVLTLLILLLYAVSLTTPSGILG